MSIRNPHTAPVSAELYCPLFTAIAIAVKSVAWPCGACRQVLNEFAPDLRVMVTWENQVREMNLKELLPGSFGPKDLL